MDSFVGKTDKKFYTEYFEITQKHYAMKSALVCREVFLHGRKILMASFWLTARRFFMPAGICLSGRYVIGNTFKKTVEPPSFVSGD
jgi:hypothetical protein